MKTVKVKVNNSNLMRRAEVASISLTSPTGNTITLYKKNLSKVNQSAVDLFWKCANHNEIDLTVEEMKLAFDFSKHSVFYK